MNSTNDATGLVLAGRPIDSHEAWTRVFRYCGLPWDDNPPETWAFRYFDAVDTHPDLVTTTDMACAGVLHPGLTRNDLGWFWEHRRELDDWLAGIPVDASLRDHDDATHTALVELPALASGTSLSLVTKVLHRKRPWLIPMIDREVIDWYRPLTGQRRAVDAWEPLLEHLAEDLRTNREQLAELRAVLLLLHGISITDLRTVDVVIWMGGQR
jgi:hypothetical protein